VCWGCRKSGETLDLVELLDGIDRMEAIRRVLAGYVGGDSPTALEASARIPPPARTDLTRLPVVPYPRGAEPLVWGHPAHLRVWRYLIEERRLRREDIERYRVGAGLYGWLEGYAVFPCYMDGGLVYWQGRACWDPPKHLNGDQRRAWSKATGYRKTLNLPSSEERVGASEILLNYDAARTAQHVVIVEGPIDAVQVGASAVALLGKVPTPTKVERLLRMHAMRYTVYLDPGVEERAKAEALATQLSDFAPTFIATPPVGYDPGSLTPEQNAYVIEKAPAFRARGLVSELRIR
jgi:hypothetical protein